MMSHLTSLKAAAIIVAKVEEITLALGGRTRPEEKEGAQDGGYSKFSQRYGADR